MQCSGNCVNVCDSCESNIVLQLSEILSSVSDMFEQARDVTRCATELDEQIEWLIFQMLQLNLDTHQEGLISAFMSMLENSVNQLRAELKRFLRQLNLLRFVEMKLHYRFYPRKVIRVTRVSLDILVSMVAILDATKEENIKEVNAICNHMRNIIQKIRKILVVYDEFCDKNIQLNYLLTRPQLTAQRKRAKEYYNIQPSVNLFYYVCLTVFGT